MYIQTTKRVNSFLVSFWYWWDVDRCRGQLLAAIALVPGAQFFQLRDPRASVPIKNRTTVRNKKQDLYVCFVW